MVVTNNFAQRFFWLVAPTYYNCNENTHRSINKFICWEILYLAKTSFIIILPKDSLIAAT